jgi:MYXO-CTERM domain-containing protein
MERFWVRAVVVVAAASCFFRLALACDYSSGSCVATTGCQYCDLTTDVCKSVTGPDCTQEAQATNLCVTAASCVSGVCKAKSFKACDAPHTDATHPAVCFGPSLCAPATGQCAFTIKTGTACQDPDSCTKNDVCHSDGSCSGQPAPCLDPGIPCLMKPACDGMGGCIPQYWPSSTSCKSTNLCSTGDHCDGAGKCVAGLPKACASPPNLQCYAATGICDEANGNCGYTKKDAGSSCDDGDPCTFNDQCQPNGDCKGVQGPTCGATAACAIAGACDGKGGCAMPEGSETHGDCPGKAAGQGCTTCNPCVTGQTCDPSGACVGTALENGSPCTSDRCPAGMCGEGECRCASTPSSRPGSTASSGDGGVSGGVPAHGCAVGQVPRAPLSGLVLALAVGLLLVRRRMG